MSAQTTGQLVTSGDMPAPMDAATEHALILRAKAGDREARNTLALTWAEWAWKHAIRVTRSASDHIGILSEDDLFQEAVIGILTYAIDGYDPDKGYRFSTYATWWIRQHIARAIDGGAATIRVPEYILTARRKVLRVAGQLTQELGREVNADDLLASGRVTAWDIEHAARMHDAPASLDVSVIDRSDGGQPDTSTLGAMLLDEDAPSVEEEAIRPMMRAALRALMRARLNEREYLVLCLRYGLDPTDDESECEALTLDQTGKRVGLTRERIRQIENHALAKLRDPRILRQIGDVTDAADERSA